MIGVQFDAPGRIYYYEAPTFPVSIGDQIVMLWQDCEYLATVVHVDVKDKPLAEAVIQRVATQEDIQQQHLNEEDATRALPLTIQKIDECQLEMRIMSIEYSLDRKKMIFYFTADQRIDFRQLVKSLATVFKTRIELRQIGVRDEARLLGGIGACGRPLCCHTFLGDFLPVSIKMAKNQHLSLNPTKISGVCGRLMCCLQYENEQYEEAKRQLPDIGASIQTPDGDAVVTGLNILNHIVQVTLQERPVTVNYTLEELMPYIMEEEANG